MDSNVSGVTFLRGRESYPMTREDFIRWLVQTKTDVVVRPFHVRPCDCGDMNCHGWRLVKA